MMSTTDVGLNSTDGTMRVALQRGLRAMELDRMPRPEALPGTVLVKVANVGICGSDLHAYRNSSAQQSFPHGHELSGIVVETGVGATRFQAGQRVTIDMVLGTACGVCEYCKRGAPIHCRAREFPFGGGFADYVRTKEAGVFPLPDTVDDQLGAIVEPVAVGVHACRKMRIAPGMTGVVVGAGTIGLAAAAAALDAGSEKVYVVARHPAQARAAMAIGASAVVPSDRQEAVKMVEELTGGLGVDYAMEAVGGTADTLDFACQFVRPLGMVGVLGAFDHGFRGVEIIAPHIKELTLHLPNCYGCIDGKQDFALAIDLLARKGNSLRAMITHELALEDIQEAFRLADDKSSESIKVQIRM
ncbi:alcohol dehydrogenase catalytic domain-containing protein [Paraburkholderia strydomiana]|uniref:(R,R)-butanediol dehydrogenase/meso-butanediol dehydrogenase/diacetyl reductase/L-iditol 2-dehydrogenase n=1 Tax=Paraburkholderia caledonica TaxID=134536 RepID=A0ABU1KUJ0_9BURK|nr:alcohol dehydrogenase catalytic domain-containing protein [Paraburkholderia caledonica]MDR6374614.1 (R,R)-butanediol dehydrogenase/meso-butanediol dehydrogenase/diacetyl reductase/L-iditol 2-dehydrogenase [Paraburkholderia caledonica]